ncbi:hypothetical protein [Shinella sp. BYT-45]|uniref:hypothetical protein n=1 Tax=Shinella sp. BYT-45 TaxID=3377377 RepID=UPI00397F1EA8
MEVVFGAFHNILRPLLMARDKRELRTAPGRWQEDKWPFVHNRRAAGNGFGTDVDKTHGHGKVSRLSTGHPHEDAFTNIGKRFDSKSKIRFSLFFA